MVPPSQSQNDWIQKYWWRGESGRDSDDTDIEERARMIPISLDEVRQDVVGPLPELQSRRRRVINMVAMAWQRTQSFWRFYSLVATTITILTILLAVILSRAYAIKYTHVVDLGYSKYRGFKGSNCVSQWLGMRYAAPPLGSLRFRVAQDPLNTTDIQAVVEVSIYQACFENTIDFD